MRPAGHVNAVKALGFVLLTEGVWVVGGSVLAVGSAEWWPMVDGPLRWLGIAVIASGGWLSYAADRALIGLGGGTPLLRWPPQRLVTSGPYARVRHPQAIGLVLVTIGTALLIDDPAVWFLPVLAAVYEVVALLPAEAKQLTDRFGDEYIDYVAAVPGWVPLLR